MYAKLFSRITESSLMEETIPVRYTFVLLLAISDPTGHVIGTDVAIARRLNMPLEEFQLCIRQLMEPDANSNSKEEEGRRVVLSQGERGYRIVNFTTYRNMKDEDDKRAYMRDYMRKRRETNKEGGVLNSVNSRKHPLTDVTQAEAEAEAEAEDPQGGSSLESEAVGDRSGSGGVSVSKTDSNSVAVSRRSDGGASRKKSRSEIRVQTTEEIIAEFQLDETYSKLNVKQEFGKASVWCRVNHRQPTKRFLMGWLNRELQNQPLQIGDISKAPPPMSEYAVRSRIEAIRNQMANIDGDFMAAVGNEPLRDALRIEKKMLQTERDSLNGRA